MDPILVISIGAFIGAAALAAALVNLSFDFQGTKAEDRLELLAGGGRSPSAEAVRKGIVKEDLIQLGKGTLAGISKFTQMGSWSLYLEQADSPVSFAQLIMISAGCAVVGTVGAMLGNAPVPLYPVVGLILSTFPFIWLSFRRAARFKAFAKQLPDALELIGRALRSGHALGSGLNLVVHEMPAPISHEFSLAYEQQNLGVSIEQALKSMLRRMPNLDLKFFVTAVAIQRQCGGDLAEILDKIGYVIRERFKILGTVQALTGEGRLSGVVLMILPIAIFIAVYYLNPSYVMLLFTTPLGKKMITAGIVMQVMGAYVINKIIDIKV